VNPKRPKRRRIGKVAIVVKPHIRKASPIVLELAEWFRQHRIKPFVEDRFADQLQGKVGYFPARKPPRDVDLVVVIGGDGTFLSVARAMGARQVPILGVNAGSLGFLTDTSLSDLYTALESVLAGDYTIQSRMMLDSDLARNGAVRAKHTILNDVVITKGAIARMIEVGVAINKQLVAVIRADGIIVSTPTGSTAYSLAAGGPVLYPGIGSIILTPICPHTLTYRPLVVSDRSEVELTLRSSSGEVYVTFDGQVSVPMLQGDRVRARKSRSRLKVIHLPGHNYFQVLRHKLRWAERPRSTKVAASRIQKPKKR
jgi:NAD+ kinase